MGELARAWITAVDGLGGDASRGQPWADDAARRYGAPTRGYHGTAHVLAVLREVAALAPAAGLGPLERAGVDAAAIAHDVVYVGVPGQDEQRSADWAKAALLAAGVGAHAADRVHALVMATASHEAPAGDAAAAVLLDADLAILASAPSEYAAYVTAVRGEYLHLDDAQWAAGRTAVLTSLVARDVLFHTAAGRARWDAAARANLRAEVAGLAGDCAKPAERD